MFWHWKRLLSVVLASLLLVGTVGGRTLPDGTRNPLRSVAQMLGLPGTDPLAGAKKVHVIGVGDCIVHNAAARDAALNAAGSARDYNFKPYFAALRARIQAADVAFVNQETPMAADSPISFYPRFNSPQDLGRDLVELGFDVVNLATNHMLDVGAKGLESTISFWKKQPVMMIGGYENQEDYDTPRVLETNGIKIAFLSYTYGTNGLVLGSNSKLVIPYLNETVIRRQMAAAKEVADAVIVSMHWGEDSGFAIARGLKACFTPNEQQRKYAQLLADLGADVILGHHPHVIQPVEWISGQNGHRTLCVFSLGNVMSQMAYDYNMLGGMISFDLYVTPEHKVQVEEVQFLPIVTYFPNTFLGNRAYYLEDFSEALAAKHGISYYGHSMKYSTLISYVTDTIDASFLPEFFRQSAA